MLDAIRSEIILLYSSYYGPAIHSNLLLVKYLAGRISMLQSIHSFVLVVVVSSLAMLFSVIFTPPPNPLFLFICSSLFLENNSPSTVGRHHLSLLCAYRNIDAALSFQTVIKVYLSYRIILFNFAYGFLLGSPFRVDSYMIEVVNMRLNSLSLFMVLVILLVSPCAIPCPIDHSTIMDSYLSLVYISLPQFPMITSVLPNDPIITSPN